MISSAASVCCFSSAKDSCHSHSITALRSPLSANEQSQTPLSTVSTQTCISPPLFSFTSPRYNQRRNALCGKMLSDDLNRAMRATDYEAEVKTQTLIPTTV